MTGVQTCALPISHEEGGERLYSIATQKFSGDANGRVTTLHAARVEMVSANGRTEFAHVPGSEFDLKADLVLLILDCRTGETPEDKRICERLPSAVTWLKVMNKIDLAGRGASKEIRDGSPVVWLSAKTGDGVDLLRSSLLEAAGWKGEPEGVFMARARHLEALSEAKAHLEHAGRLLDQAELFAEELRLAQAALGRITGEVTPDDLLGQIFSRFCIGK